MKYIDLITDAFRLRNIIDTTQAPDAEQGTTAVRLFNNMMARMKADGVDLQYVPITYAQVANELTIPDYANEGITAALAVRLAAGSLVTPELQKQYDDGMQTINNRAMAEKLAPPNLDHIPAGEADRRVSGDFYNS